jgi:hypothetical protein
VFLALLVATSFEVQKPEGLFCPLSGSDSKKGLCEIVAAGHPELLRAKGGLFTQNRLEKFALMNYLNKPITHFGWPI